MKKNNKISHNPLEIKETYSKDEYIQSLEISVELLQKEVEILRAHLFPISNEKLIKDKTKNKLNSLNIDLSELNNYINKITEIRSLENLLDISNNIINKYFNNPITYYKYYNNFIINENENEEIISKFNYLEEQGIVDWSFDQQRVIVIPDLQNYSENKIALISFGNKLEKLLSIIILCNKNIDDSKFQSDEFLKIFIKIFTIKLSHLLSEHKAGELNNRLEALNNQLIDSSKYSALGTIAGNISEEIKSNVKLLEAHTNLLKTGVGDTARRFEIIDEGINKLKEVSSTFESFINESDTVNNLEEISIKEVISHVSKILNNTLNNKNIKLTLEFDSNTFKIKASKHQIEQVIINLIINSTETMPDGGAIKIGAYRKGSGYVSINISDDGIGIKEEELPVIFDPLHKRENESKNGLALFFVKNLVLVNHGRISIISEYGKGSTYKLIFPLL